MSKNWCKIELFRSQYFVFRRNRTVYIPVYSKSSRKLVNSFFHRYVVSVTNFLEILSRYILLREKTCSGVLFNPLASRIKTTQLRRNYPGCKMCCFSVVETRSLSKSVASITSRRIIVKKRSCIAVNTDRSQKVLLQYRKNESSASKKVTQNSYRENEGNRRHSERSNKMLKHDSLTRTEMFRIRTSTWPSTGPSHRESDNSS